MGAAHCGYTNHSRTYHYARVDAAGCEATAALFLRCSFAAANIALHNGPQAHCV